MEAPAPPFLCKQFKFLFGKGILVINKRQTPSLANPEEVVSLARGHRKPPVSPGCWPDATGVLLEQEHNSAQAKSTDLGAVMAGVAQLCGKDCTEDRKKCVCGFRG